MKSPKSALKKIKNHETILNIVSSLLLQLVTIGSGFIIPHLILSTFGSETNGLISSLNQFLNYINLVEGGLSGVILANLYKPLTKKNYPKASSILKAATKFYRKLSLVFIIYTLALALLYPLFTESSFTYGYIASLTLILSLNLFIQYCFAITWRQLLQADKKVYIVSFTQIACVLTNLIITAVLINIYPNIHVIKLLSALSYLIQPLFYHFYVKKHYPLKNSAEPDPKALSERWNGFGINIAAFIHYNTDIVVLTIATSLADVSIYSVHALISSGLRSLIQSISSGLSPSVGHAYASDDKSRLTTTFTAYEFIMTTITFFFFLMGLLLITPFVQFYTRDISDTNYYQPLFAAILILGEFIYCLREPYVSLSYSANRFKSVAKYAYIESILNISLSLLLVIPLGLLGVAIGTLISMTYRTAMQILYLKHHILHYSLKPRLRLYSIFTIFSLISYLLATSLLTFSDFSLAGWIIFALKNLLIVAPVYLLMLFLSFRSEIKTILKRK